MAPVSDADAPGYSDVIKQPMDLGTIKNKMEIYRSSDQPHESFAKDVRLVWGNCMKYNEDNSEFVKWANTLSTMFEAAYLRDIVGSGGTGSGSSTGGPKQGKKRGALTTKVKSAKKSKQGPQDPEDKLKKCEQILTTIRGQKHAWPFLQPVNDSIAPGYSDIITKPMDLGTIQSKMGSYKSHESFAEDMRLVWSNCKKFNEDHSEFGAWALKLSKKFEDAYRKDVLLLSGPPTQEEETIEEEIEGENSVWPVTHKQQFGLFLIFVQRHAFVCCALFQILVSMSGIRWMSIQWKMKALI
jgi:hypothetical protein